MKFDLYINDNMVNMERITGLRIKILYTFYTFLVNFTRNINPHAFPNLTVFLKHVDFCFPLAFVFTGIKSLAKPVH